MILDNVRCHLMHSGTFRSLFYRIKIEIGIFCIPCISSVVIFSPKEHQSLTCELIQLNSVFIVLMGIKNIIQALYQLVWPCKITVTCLFTRASAKYIAILDHPISHWALLFLILLWVRMQSMLFLFNNM